MSELITAIRSAVKSMIKPDLVLGEVMSFDSSNWTINVKLNTGASVDEVTVKSVLNGEDSGIFIEPKTGSFVLCGLTDGKIENLSVLVFSEIENIRFAPYKKIEFRNTDFGGLVKIQELEKNLNKLKSAIETIKTATAAGLTSVGAGGAANGATGAATFNSQTASLQIQFEAMENKNVQHG